MTDPDKKPEPGATGTAGGELPLAGRMPALPGESRASIRPPEPADTPGTAEDDPSDKPTVSLTRSELVADPGDGPTTRIERPQPDDGETRRLPPPLTVTAPDEEPTVPTPAAAASGTGARPTGNGTGGQAEAAPQGAGDDQAADAAGREVAVSPEPVNAVDIADQAVDGKPTGVPQNGGTTDKPEKKRKSRTSGGALIAVLLALFGFTLVVQLRSNNTDEGLASARQEDLVRILSDLESQDARLQQEITALETSQRKLTSGVAGREAALAEADRRAEELGLLAGTLPGQGPGLRITMVGVKASGVLNAVQELRGAGGEVMQVQGSGGQPVRIVASTYFVDAQEGGIAVDGERMAGPYTLSVIGPPQTMETALNIPGGVVASVEGDGGSVQVERREVVDVTALRKATTLQYARPVS